MEGLKNELKEFFSGEPAGFGVADITGLNPLSTEYPRALSIILPYTSEFKVYDEGEFHGLLEDVRDLMKDIVGRLSDLLHSSNGGIKHLVVPQGGQDPETLTAFFPHKLAAVRAGLGWIGKSSLLITREYGPRVYLATVLVDCNIGSDKPVLKSECGSCSECLKACPHLCINNVNWHSGVPREELLDVYICNAKREEVIESKGRKDECGLCLLACPYGKDC